MLSPRLIPAAALLLAFAACARPSPQSSPTPAATHVAVRRPSAAATVKPVAAAPARAAAPASGAPAPTPKPKPTPVLRAPNAAPRIIDVRIASMVHPGQRVTGYVRTTSNVASVECRIGTYGIAMQKTGVGTFAIDYAVDNMAFFLRGTYSMRVIARNAAGDSAERTVPLTIQ